ENGISKVAKPLPQYQHQGTQGEDRRSRRTSVTSYLQATSPKGPTRVRRTGQVLPEEKPWERWMSSRVSRGPRGDALLGLLERWGRRGGIDGRARPRQPFFFPFRPPDFREAAGEPSSTIPIPGRPL